MFTISKTSWILLAVLAIGTSRVLFPEDTNPLINSACKANGIDGQCIFIAKCAQALQLLRLGDYDTARNMLCGFEKSDVLVCCPKEKSEDRITFMNKTDEPITAIPVSTPAPAPALELVSEINNEPVRTTARPTSKPTTARPTMRVTTALPPTTTEAEGFKKDSYGLPDRSVCGVDTVIDRIYGGTVATPEEFSWLARLAIRRNKKVQFACSGSLISDRYVLTAAHCASGNEIVGVRLGEWDAETDQDCYRGVCTDPPVDIKVDKVIIHSSFSRPEFLNDIALLRLKKPVNFTDYIRPVCLPTTSYIARQDYSSDSAYETAGWGFTEFGTVSAVKRKVQLNSVKMDVCKIALPILQQSFNNTIICAGGRDGADSCKGDSGGPLVKKVSEDYRVNWFIYGITSFGATRCGTETKPAVYTRVSSYMPWIINNIKT